MELPLQTLNSLVASGAVLLEMGAVALLVLYFLRKKYDWAREVSDLFADWGLWIGALLSLFTIGISLYYSEVLGFIPCGLCWTIRIFSYPLFFLFALALWKKDFGIADYIITLSIPGLLVAIYQHYLQMGGSELVACPTAGAGADCAERFLFEYGHVTFPWVAVAFFAFLIALMLHVRLRKGVSSAEVGKNQD